MARATSLHVHTCVISALITSPHASHITMSSKKKPTMDAAAAPKPSSLSRNSLYTPLIAYDQEKVDPSQYMTTARSSVPTSLRESSLVDFVQTVSAETSDKPLSTQAIEERMRQRALTLVGGGINSRMTCSSKQRSHHQRRQHEQLSNRQKKKIGKREKAKQTDANPKQEDAKAFDALLQVNRKWNVYVRKLARVDQLQDDKSIQKTLSSRLAHLEVVGASVTLIECRAHEAWVGKEGMIVDTTTNTWRLAIIKVSGIQTQKQQPRVLVVPKKGSKLMFKLTISENRSPLCIVIRGDET